MLKKIIKIICGIIIAAALIFLIYLAYVLISYHRVQDNLTLDISGQASKEAISYGETYRLVSANCGFGAYSDDYSFFMDGGTESWAFSKQAAIDNIDGSITSIMGLNPDIIALQEIDIDSTRSYHVNQMDQVVKALKANDILGNYTFGLNYDSPFLFYPLTQPHGKSVAGLVTYSSFPIDSAIRRSLPIEEGFSKLIDLDRCYVKNYIEIEDGKKLVLYNVHLSAYTTNPATAENQVIMLNEDMFQEYTAGNYIIACGDMNKDLLGDSSAIFKRGSLDLNWAAPFPTELLSDKFSVIAPFDANNPIPSCRNADEPYSDTNFVLTIDGFIVSDNISVNDTNVLDLQFKYSDHNPVYLDFTLN